MVGRTKWQDRLSYWFIKRTVYSQYGGFHSMLRIKTYSKGKKRPSVLAPGKDRGGVAQKSMSFESINALGHLRD